MQHSERDRPGASKGARFGESVRSAEDVQGLDRRGASEQARLGSGEMPCPNPVRGANPAWHGSGIGLVWGPARHDAARSRARRLSPNGGSEHRASGKKISEEDGFVNRKTRIIVRMKVRAEDRSGGAGPTPETGRARMRRRSWNFLSRHARVLASLSAWAEAQRAGTSPSGASLSFEISEVRRAGRAASLREPRHALGLLRALRGFGGPSRRGMGGEA